MAEDVFTLEKTRIIQEFVPGKQVTIARLIANPNRDIVEAALVYSMYALANILGFARSEITGS